MLLRGMRWRLGASLLMVFTAAVAVGAAVLGPLYLRAAGDSLIRGSVAGAPVEQSGVTFAPEAGAHVTLAQLTRDTQRLSSEYGLSRWYGHPLTTVISGVGVPLAGGSHWQGQLLYRTGICGKLRFRSGGCRLGSGDVLVSSRSARVLQVKLGSRLVLTVPHSASPLQLRVTGIYSVPNLALQYWWGDGRGYFPFGTSTGSSAPQTDGLITSAATALAVPAADVPAATVQVPLRRGAVGLTDKGAVEQTLASVKHAASRHGVMLSTGLTQLVADAQRQGHLMNTIVGVASIQLVLVAVWVLAALLLRSADLRGSELRIARLRGFPLSSLFAVAVAEPAILCLVGAVAGVAGAWLVTALAKGLFMSASTSISAGPLVLAALGAAIVTVAVVLVATALQALRNSDLREQAVVGHEPSGRLRLVADVSLLLLAVVALVALATSGALADHGDPIASAAPGLLALGTTVIAVQLVLFLCRRGVILSADSRWVSGMLALRQVARRPAILREGRVLIVTLCLACFAVSAWSVARSNRRTAAAFSVGASRVLTVSPHGTGLQQAVDKVDPHGRFAMAAVQISTSTAEVLAVDSRRLPAVASWPGGITRATIGAVSRALRPATAAPVNVPAGSLQVDAHVAATGKLASRLGNFDLSAWVFNSSITTTVVNLGPLRPGTGTYSGSTRLVCPGGCRLIGVGVVPSPGRSGVGSNALVDSDTIDLTLDRVAARSHGAAYRTLSAHVSAAGWRAATQGVSANHRSSGATFAISTVALAEYEGGVASDSAPMVAVADYPENLPGVAGAASLNGASTLYGRQLIASQGLDGNPISIRPVITASSLPRVGSDAQLVDLTLLSRAQIDPLAPGATDEVWLNSAAPPDALARLSAAGLTIDGVQRATQVASNMQQAGPELAYDFMLLAMLVALLAGAASTLGLLGSEVRERATELTALEVAGVPRPLLVRALSLETAVLALTALFGAVAGVIGSALAIPSLPEATAQLSAPRSYALPWPLLVAVCAGMVIVIAAAAAVSTAGVLRRMSPTLLWSASDGG